MLKLKTGEKILFVFNFLYLLGYLIYYFYARNFEFMLYIGVVFAFFLIILLTIRRTNFDYVALWGLSIWGLLHMLGGSLKVGDGVLYAYKIIDIIQGSGQFYILRMDQVIHFYGFMVAAIAIYQLLAPRYRKEASTSMLVFISIIASMGLGAFNEVVEFIAFVLVDKTGVGDVYNTGLDLIFNTFGAITGGLISMLRDKSR